MYSITRWWIWAEISPTWETVFGEIKTLLICPPISFIHHAKKEPNDLAPRYMLSCFLSYCKSNQVPEAFVYLNLVPGLLEHIPNIKQIYYVVGADLARWRFGHFLRYTCSIADLMCSETIPSIHNSEKASFLTNTRSIDCIFQFLPLCKRLVQNVLVFEIMSVLTAA